MADERMRDGHSAAPSNAVTEINEALNLKVNMEVEHRAKEWIEKAKGTDWTAKFEGLMRENAELKDDVTKWINERNNKEIDRALLEGRLDAALAALKRVVEATTGANEEDGEPRCFYCSARGEAEHQAYCYMPAVLAALEKAEG